MVENRQRSQTAIERDNRRDAKRIAKLCCEGRAEDIVVLDMRKVCDFTDYFVIATGASAVRLRGIAEEIRQAMRDAGRRLLAEHGADSGKWIVLDYGDIVVHLFDQPTRAFYALEVLWGDAKKVRF